MSNIIQLDLFKSYEESEFDALRARVDKVYASSEKVRKGLFGKLGTHEKRLLELEDKMGIIERNLCKGAMN